MDTNWIATLRKHPYTALNVLTLAVALGMVGFLSLKSRQQREQMRSLYQQARYPVRGVQLTPVTMPSLHSGDWRFGFGIDSERVVLFYFTTTCKYCLESLPAWKEIARAAHSEGVPVFGVSLDSSDSTKAYSKAHQLNFPIVLARTPFALRGLRAHAVPQTLITTGDGQVIYGRSGAISGSAAVDSVLANLTSQRTKTTTSSTNTFSERERTHD